MPLPEGKRNKKHSCVNSIFLSWHHVKLNLSSVASLFFPNEVPDSYRLQDDQRTSRGEEWQNLCPILACRDFCFAPFTYPNLHPKKTKITHISLIQK